MDKLIDAADKISSLNSNALLVIVVLAFLFSGLKAWELFSARKKEKAEFEFLNLLAIDVHTLTKSLVQIASEQQTIKENQEVIIEDIKILKSEVEKKEVRRKLQEEIAIEKLTKSA